MSGTPGSPTLTLNEGETDRRHRYYNDPDAEITLRSADGVLFKAHAVLLKLASDVFAGMVTIPQSQENTTDVVQLTEESDIICALLDFIYPRRAPPKLHSFSFVSRLSEAADKYDISDASRYIRERLTKTTVTISGNALEQYSLACRSLYTGDSRRPVRRETLQSSPTPLFVYLLIDNFVHK